MLPLKRIVEKTEISGVLYAPFFLLNDWFVARTNDLSTVTHCIAQKCTTAYCEHCNILNTSVVLVTLADTCLLVLTYHVTWPCTATPPLPSQYTATIITHVNPLKHAELSACPRCSQPCNLSLNFFAVGHLALAGSVDASKIADPQTLVCQSRRYVAPLGTI